MDENIIKVTDKNKILNILHSFTPRLRSLNDGIVDPSELAEKYYKYGEVLLLSEKDAYIGFAAFYCNDTSAQTAYLSMLALNSEYEGKGYGRKLIRTVIHNAKIKGMVKLKLEVNKMNNRAINFYSKLGFLTTSENSSSFYMELNI